LDFKVAPRSITITAVDPPTYRPTQAEWVAIRKGEAAIARGESVTLTEFLHGLDRSRRKAGANQVAKLPVKDQQRIGAAVRAMADDPFSGDIIKLEARTTAGDAESVSVGSSLPLIPPRKP
jgi:hypothetical protein